VTTVRSERRARADARRWRALGPAHEELRAGLRDARQAFEVTVKRQGVRNSTELGNGGPRTAQAIRDAAARTNDARLRSISEAASVDLDELWTLAGPRKARLVHLDVWNPQTQAAEQRRAEAVAERKRAQTEHAEHGLEQCLKALARLDELERD